MNVKKYGQPYHFRYENFEKDDSTTAGCLILRDQI